MSFSIGSAGSAPSPEQMRALREKMQERAFKSADADGDGSISKTEFAAAKPKDAPADAPSSDDVFSKIDTDGDGSVTKAEFSAFGDQLKGQLNGMQGAGQFGPPPGPPPAKAARSYESQLAAASTSGTSQTATTDSDDEDDTTKLLQAALSVAA
jgi:hypothetical protein